MTISVRGILCDDIRREDNGKLLIVGAYNQDMVVSSVPAHSALSLWILGEGFPQGNTKFEVTLDFPGGSPLTSSGEIYVDHPRGAASVIFIGIPVELREYGEIVGNLKLEDGTDCDFLHVAVVRPADVGQTPTT